MRDEIGGAPVGIVLIFSQREAASLRDGVEANACSSEGTSFRHRNRQPARLQQRSQRNRQRDFRVHAAIPRAELEPRKVGPARRVSDRRGALRNGGWWLTGMVEVRHAHASSRYTNVHVVGRAFIVTDRDNDVVRAFHVRLRWLVHISAPSLGERLDNVAELMPNIRETKWTQAT